MAAERSERETALRLLGYLRPYRVIAIVAVLAVTLRSGGDTALLVLLKPVVALLEKQTAQFSDLTHNLGWLVLFGLVLAVLEWAQAFLIDWVAQRLIHDLRRDFFAAVHSLSLAFFEDTSTGALMSRATNNINTVQTLFTNQLSELLRFPLMAFGLVGYMLFLSIPLTIICTGVLLLLVPLMSRASRLTKRSMLDFQDRLADLSARLEESLAAVRVVQCFDAGRYEIERFAVENEQARLAVMQIVRIRACLTPLLRLLGLLGIGALLWGGGYLLFVLHSVEYNELFIVVAALLLINTRSKIFGRMRLSASEVLAASEQVFRIIDLESDVRDAPDAIELREVTGRVTFDHVGFRYRTGATVLEDIVLELAPGEAVAVVGQSGSGKSTLANLIPRLYDATSGRVLIDGHDVREVTISSLRAQIGIVPQETLLFRGTIRENIAYGRRDADDQQIHQAARAANAHRFIVGLPEGYETQVGERGAKLSGGQAQRIAIARAILRDPKILILDEATSSLDSESERLVQEALERLMRDRTTLIIAHRLSTIQNAHRIVVIQDGRIAQQGTHRELLTADGPYRRAYLIQGGEAVA